MDVTKKSPKIVPRQRTESELNMKWEYIAELAREARAFAESKIQASNTKRSSEIRPRSKSSSSIS
jgi:hypothetical protein